MVAAAGAMVMLTAGSLFMTVGVGGISFHPSPFHSAIAFLLCCSLLAFPSIAHTPEVPPFPSLMGKGKNPTAGAASVSAAPKKTRGESQKSTVAERHLTELRKGGLLPPLVENKMRLPDGEVIPRPRADERVAFVDFMNRGLSFPVHGFLCGLLYAYGVQLHDFSPNAILDVACFISLYECFLGVHPH